MPTNRQNSHQTWQLEVVYGICNIVVYVGAESGMSGAAVSTLGRRQTSVFVLNTHSFYAQSLCYTEECFVGIWRTGIELFLQKNIFYLDLWP